VQETVWVNDKAEALASRRRTCPIARFTSRTSCRGGTFRSSEEPSKQATRSVISGSTSLAEVMSASSLSACSFRFFCFFFDRGFDSSPSLAPFPSVSRAAKNDAVSSSSSTAAYSAHAE
jgi:hypothetical protein